MTRILGETANHVTPRQSHEVIYPSPRVIQLYSELFSLLRADPVLVASLCQSVQLTEIDDLLQTVMFSLYGCSTEDEHLLLAVFRTLISSQFESTLAFDSLMRPNTPLSRAIIPYTRRESGQAYLRAVFPTRINRLIEHKEMVMEIDPVKVYDQLVDQIETVCGTLPPELPREVSPEVAARDPNVQAIIAPRVKMLEEIASTFVSDIVESLASVPFGVRWICKQLKQSALRHHPHATDHELSSLLGNLFLQRFLIPAIVTPQAYHLITGVVPKHPRRILTLVAKSLEGLVTVLPCDEKPYLAKLSPFVERNQARMDDFLQKLCCVDDFEPEPESILKDDTTINVKLNELFTTHRLLMSHVEALTADGREHLRTLLNELGPAPPLVPQHLCPEIRLQLSSRQ